MAKREPTRLNMTGEEFKKFIEQTNPDGVVDTIPEIMNAMRNINDYGETIDEIIRQAMEDKVGTVSDIDEIFN